MPTGPVPPASRPVLAALVGLVLLLTGCAGNAVSNEAAGSSTAGSAGASAGAGPTAGSAGSSIGTGAVTLPPLAGRFSYQIGGNYPPAQAVTIVDRDRTAAADPGRYSICYLNAYQAQPEDVGWWQSQHPKLLLTGADGRPVIDRQWNEPLLDLSTDRLRSELLGVVGGWIDGCASHGYRAVEADNLDSYTRSDGLLTAADALAYGQALADRAHRDGLALGQKNAADQSAQAHRAGFDFAIAEECQVYDECAAYTDVYGRELIEIEYTDQPASAFSTACALRGGSVSVVLRDRDVTPAGDAHHVERWC